MEITKDERARFPIRTADEFFNFFESHLKKGQAENEEPNLAFISILLGYLEYRLTLTKTTEQQSSGTESDESIAKQRLTEEGKQENASKLDQDTKSQHSESNEEFPFLDIDIVEPLYQKFTAILKGLIDKSSTENTTRGGYASRELCKKVSDIMWNRLHPHYHKDKPHIQSLFSFLTGHQLDCFGLAFAVIAACQVLRYSDVHLALSEDHAWAAHGDNSKEMTEITWHGKGTEDKRGMPLKQTDVEKCWMYLHNNAIVCNRMMEVSTMVVAINPAIDNANDSKVLSDLQHRLLRLMFSLGALDKYPMGLGLLAELEESSTLHMMAVKAVAEHYGGSHVFPYCTQGRFFSRQNESKKAIQCWAKAAKVLSMYNYTREDEEIYKEIMEIARDLIPHAMKVDPTICEDKECFMDFINFYDGICLWEEGSPTPVLHSWWAKFFTQSLGRFSNHVRESFKEDKHGGKEKDRVADHTTEGAEAKAVASRKSKRHSMRKEDENLSNDQNKINDKSKLGLKSMKMKGLEELLVCGRKINAHTVSLQMTAQSQVHFVKRRSNVSDYSVEYAARTKRQKISGEYA